MKRMMLRIFALLTLALVLLPLCACTVTQKAAPLPPPEADEGNMFGVDTHINMDTIDAYLGRDDVAYRDVRMLFDPADYGAIGGEADLTRTIEGFKIVPYPFLATLQALPVSGAYEGQCLYSVEWSAEGRVVSAVPNYAESELILTELFPKDKAVFIMCGGGGYAGMTRELLRFLGWDEGLLYNIGGNWSYTGAHPGGACAHPEDAEGDLVYATWRADYAYIDFDRLHAVKE